MPAIDLRNPATPAEAVTAARNLCAHPEGGHWHRVAPAFHFEGFERAPPGWAPSRA